MMGSGFLEQVLSRRRIGELLGGIIIFNRNREPAYHDVCADKVIHGPAREVKRRPVEALREDAPPE